MWSVGDAKDFTVNGETLTTEIVGFNHDQLTSGGTAGITFGTRDCMAALRQMNSTNTNEGGYTNSDLYNWLTTTVYNGLQSDLKSVIKAVNKQTTGGYTDTSVHTESMKVWLFSLSETTDDSSSAPGYPNSEGARYPIFTGDASTVKKLSNGNGEDTYWWLRSPGAGYSSGAYDYYKGFFCIGVRGGRSYDGTPTSQHGICFGFCV